MSMTTNVTSPRYLHDDPTVGIPVAHTYFDQLGLAEGDADYDPNIQDSDGLVSYIVATSNPVPDALKVLYNEIKPVMEGLSNVVVSAILKQTGTDPKKQHDPSMWRGPMQAMTKAFCGGFSRTAKHYHQSVRGVDVATKFLNILLDAVISEGAALADFRQFLESQGETMRAEISGGQNSYLYANVAITHELFQGTDGTWIYVPKFKSYFTQFNQETFKLTSSCASYDSFKFNFDLDVMTGAFMVASWQDSQEFRDQVEDFIRKFQKVNIEDSSNYFNGIFESTQA